MIPCGQPPWACHLRLLIEMVADASTPAMTPAAGMIADAVAFAIEPVVGRAAPGLIRAPYGSGSTGPTVRRTIH